MCHIVEWQWNSEINYSRYRSFFWPLRNSAQYKTDKHLAAGDRSLLFIYFLNIFRSISCLVLLIGPDLEGVPIVMATVGESLFLAMTDVERKSECLKTVLMDWRLDKQQ